MGKVIGVEDSIVACVSGGDTDFIARVGACPGWGLARVWAGYGHKKREREGFPAESFPALSVSWRLPTLPYSPTCAVPSA